MKTLNSMKKRLISMLLTFTMTCTLFTFISISPLNNIGNVNVSAAQGDNFKITNVTAAPASGTALADAKFESSGAWELTMEATQDNINHGVVLTVEGTQDASGTSLTEPATITSLENMSSGSNDVVDITCEVENNNGKITIKAVSSTSSSDNFILTVKAINDKSTTTLVNINIKVTPDKDVAKVKTVEDIINPTTIILNHNPDYYNSGGSKNETNIKAGIEKYLKDLLKLDNDNKTTNESGSGMEAGVQVTVTKCDVSAIDLKLSKGAIEKEIKGKTAIITDPSNPVGMLATAKKAVTDELAKNNNVVTLPYSVKYFNDIDPSAARTRRALLVGQIIQEILMSDSKFTTQVYVSTATVESEKNGTYTITLKDANKNTTIFLVTSEYAEPTSADKLAEDKALIEYGKINPVLYKANSAENDQKTVYKLPASKKTKSDKEKFIKEEIDKKIQNGTTTKVTLIENTDALFVIELTNGNEKGNAAIVINQEILFESIAVFYTSADLLDEKVEGSLGIGDTIKAKIMLSNGRELTDYTHVEFTWTGEYATKNTANYTVVAGDVDKDILVEIKIKDDNTSGVTPSTRTWKTPKKVSKITSVKIVDATTEKPFDYKPYIGQKLKAVIETNSTEEANKTYSTVNYQWSNGSNVGTNADTYTVTSSDVDKKIKVTITSNDIPASVTSGVSNETSAVSLFDRVEILDMNDKPTALIDGNEIVAKIYYSGKTEYETTGWTYSWNVDSPTGTQLSAFSSLLIDADYIGKNLFLTVTLASDTSKKKSMDLGAIYTDNNGVIKTVSGIDANTGYEVSAPKIGQKINLDIELAGENNVLEKINSSDNSQTEFLKFSWYSDLDGERTLIGSGSEYTVVAADVGKKIVGVVLGWGAKRGTLEWVSFVPARGEGEDDNETVGIDMYSGKEIIIYPDDTSYGISIDLTKETFTTGTFKVAAYSVDGGNKWKAGNLPASISKILTSRDVQICISDKGIDKDSETGVIRDATIVTFPVITARPKITEKYVVNYSIGSQKNSWILTKNGSTSAKQELEVAEVIGNSKNYNYGRFYGSDGDDNGIEIKPFAGRVVKTRYVWRLAAKDNGDGTYTPASKEKRVSVFCQQKPPKYKLKNNAIAVKAGTSYSVDGVFVRTTAAKVNISEAGNIELWMAATAKKPASAKQLLRIAAPPTPPTSTSPTT